MVGAGGGPRSAGQPAGRARRWGPGAGREPRGRAGGGGGRLPGPELPAVIVPESPALPIGCSRLSAEPAGRGRGRGREAEEGGVWKRTATREVGPEQSQPGAIRRGRGRARDCIAIMIITIALQEEKKCID